MAINRFEQVSINKLTFGVTGTDYYTLEYNDTTGNINYQSKYKFSPTMGILSLYCSNLIYYGTIRLRKNKKRHQHTFWVC